MIALYLHFGPFSQYVRQRVRHDIALIDSGQWPESQWIAGSQPLSVSAWDLGSANECRDLGIAQHALDHVREGERASAPWLKPSILQRRLKTIYRPVAESSDFAICDERRLEGAGYPKSPMLLKADKVAKSFDGFTAVRGADLEVVQGEIVGLIGQFCPIPI